jgi:hypothetical protein
VSPTNLYCACFSELRNDGLARTLCNVVLEIAATAHRHHHLIEAVHPSMAHSGYPAWRYQGSFKRFVSSVEGPALN